MPSDVHILRSESPDSIATKQYLSCSLEGQQNPGLHQQKDGQQGEEVIVSPCSAFVRSAALHPGLRPPAHGGCGAVGAGPEEGHEDDQSAEISLL